LELIYKATVKVLTMDNLNKNSLIQRMNKYEWEETYLEFGTLNGLAMCSCVSSRYLSNQEIILNELKQTPVQDHVMMAYKLTVINKRDIIKQVAILEISHDLF